MKKSVAVKWGMLTRGVEFLDDNSRIHSTRRNKKILNQFNWDVFDNTLIVRIWLRVIFLSSPHEKVRTPKPSMTDLKRSRKSDYVSWEPNLWRKKLQFSETLCEMLKLKWRQCWNLVYKCNLKMHKVIFFLCRIFIYSQTEVKRKRTTQRTTLAVKNLQ